MKSLRLSFWDHSWQYDDNTPETHPLGGSHSALVYLTRELAKLGHEVHIYNNCKSPGQYNGVHYHQIKVVQDATRFLYSDAFISLRDPRIFQFWLNSGVRILWAQDAFDQEALRELKNEIQIKRNIDYIFCISRWQAWTFVKYFNWSPEKIYITRNAIWRPYFPEEFMEPRDPRIAYTSTPNRGLELLLRLYPRIRRLVPESELHVYSSMQVYQQSKEEDQKQFGHIYKLSEQPGVIMHGSIGQRDLAKELTKCKVLAYPNIYPETGCIAAMEALAAGCAIVTSHLGALQETIGPGGVFIAGIPGTGDYNKLFIENCVRLLTDETNRQKMSATGRDWILSHFTWEKVAQEWVEQINKYIYKSQKLVHGLQGWHPQNTSIENNQREYRHSQPHTSSESWRPLHLIFADDSWPFDDNTPEKEPLGGCHSALVYLTRELAALGHQVHVYNQCPSPGRHHGVEYHRFKDIGNANKFIHADAFISLRNPSFFTNWINAGVRILWVGDAFDQPHLQCLESNEVIRNNIDYIFCVSRWQAWTFLKHFHWNPHQIILTRNGVCPDFFPKEFPEPKKLRLVYTSTPFRGLELLLKLFPKIYQAVPETELHLFSSMQVYKHNKEQDYKEYGHIYKLAEQPGVVMHSSVGQKILAEELSQSRVLAYPNIFAETSCIAIMEAMAAGCAVVTSNLAALPETVGPGGVLIPGIPATDAYNEAFVDNCIRMLKDQTFWRKKAIEGREWILSQFTWDKIARQWAEQIHDLVRINKDDVLEIDGWHSPSKLENQNDCI